MSGSYKLDSFTKNRSTEVLRLKAQVELFFENELKIYKQIGMRDGFKVIECGCGPGYLLLNLARTFPNSHFTGLEIDPYLLESFQKSIAHNNTSSIVAKQGSIYETGEEDALYDLVISRLVIEHLDKPQDALAELYRILKPGGKLIIVSNDFEYHVLTHPHIPELHTMYKAYCQSRVDEGGNPYIGRELPVLLQKTGFQHIDINIATAHSTIAGDKALLKAENINISRSLVTKGYLEQEVLDRLSNKWFEMLQNPGHSIYRQLFVVSGEKQQNSTAPSSTKEEAATPNAIIQLSKLDDNGKISELTRLLTQKVLNSMDDDSLNIDSAVKLNEYYIDSLVATDIASFLKEQFKISTKLTDILRVYSVNDLVKLIMDNHSFTTIEDNEDQSEWTEGEL